MHYVVKPALPLLASALLGSGCANLLGFEDVTAVDAGANTPDAAVVDAAVPLPDADLRFVCAESEVSPALGSTTFNTETQSDTLELSCGGSGGSPETLLAWKAPVRDYYVFSTEGSSFDTVLGLLDQCDGTETACNNNNGESNASKIVRKFAKDEEALIAVDGFAGDQGDANLAIERVSCPDADLSEQALPLSLSTLGFGDDQNNSCGGEGHEDRAYHWVAPSDGLFAFSAVSDSFRTTISVHEGPECSDEVLGCSASESTDKRAEVVRRVVKDQELSLYVDGVDGSGSFDINVEDRSASTCPEGTEIPGDETVAFTPRVMSGSCGSPIITGEFGATFEPGDMSYPLFLGGLNEGCGGGCTLTAESPGAIMLYILDQPDCGGTELQCVVSEFIEPNLNRATLSMPLLVGEDQNLTVVVAGQSFLATEFTIRMECGLVC